MTSSADKPRRHVECGRWTTPSLDRARDEEVARSTAQAVAQQLAEQLPQRDQRVAEATVEALRQSDTVEVERDDLALLLATSARYIAGEAPAATDRWQEWFATMMQKYAVAAGYEELVQPMPFDMPEGRA